MTQIVVGVDGSQVSRAAFDWAVRYARMAGAKLTVVRVHEPVGDPSAATLGTALAYAPALSGPERSRDISNAARERARSANEAARERLEHELRRLLIDADVSGLDVETVAVADRKPSRVLEDYSRYAELLVVGSRGIGGVKGMVLGSVSRHVTQHSACPVVVVPAEARAETHIRRRRH